MAESGVERYGFDFFDKVVNREGVFTVKHGLKSIIFGEDARDAIPLWVADMDLPCAVEIVDALKRRMEHPTFGYTFQPSEMWLAAQTWISERHGWEVPLDAFVFCPSVVTATAAALWAFTEPADSVLLMTPLYEPLQTVVRGAGRDLKTHELSLANGVYVIDTARLEADLTGCRLLLFCNPHNPGGRVWEAAELRAVAQICHKLGVIVVSDEIWADWALFGKRYRPFAMEAQAEGCDVITLSAPTKTWSIAGLHSSFLVITNEALRKRYLSAVEHAFLHYGSTFATEATIAAYRDGGAWLRGVKDYIEAQLELCEKVLSARCAPEVVPLRPEATYLLWMDCSGLGVADPAAFFRKNAAVILSPGADFGGPSTALFARMNVATARSTLEDALERIAKAVEAHRQSTAPMQESP